LSGGRSGHRGHSQGSRPGLSFTLKLAFRSWPSNAPQSWPSNAPHKLLRDASSHDPAQPTPLTIKGRWAE
jgi:hypothetical protein